MNPTGTTTYQVADFAEIPGVECPCGTARRAFHGVEEFPGTIHVTEISADAKLHYHKKLTETYYFLECEEDAQMQLDDELVPVHPGRCIDPAGNPPSGSGQDESPDRGPSGI